MPDEYISREAAIEEIDKWLDTVGTALVGKGLSYYGELIGCIEDARTADVAEVVRCKNCKWFADNNGGEWYGCKMFQVVRITPEDAPKPDDFCSWGESK